MREIRYEKNGDMYNRAGEKTDGIRYNVQLCSMSFLDTFAAPEVLLPEEEAELFEAKLAQEAEVMAVRKMLPIILGEENYTILMLARSLSHRDIALHMNLSETAVKIRVCRARKKINEIADRVKASETILLEVEDIRYDILHNRHKMLGNDPEEFDIDVASKDYEDHVFNPKQAQ